MLDDDKAAREAAEAEREADTVPFDPAADKAKADGATAVARDPYGADRSLGNAAELDRYNPPPKPMALLTLFDGATIRPAMLRDDVCILAGTGGVGKTRAAASLAVAVATGGKWLAFDVNHACMGPVLHIAAEESEERLRSRYHAALTAANAWDSPYRSRLSWRSIRGEQARFTEPSDLAWCSLHRLVMAGWLDPATGERVPWVLVILDPASRVMDAEAEKDNAKATAWVALVERLQADSKACVLVTAHTRKANRDGAELDADDVRGSSALVAAARWVAMMQPEKKTGKVKVQLVKANDVLAWTVLADVGRDGYLQGATIADKAKQPEPAAKGNGGKRTGADAPKWGDDGPD